MALDGSLPPRVQALTRPRIPGGQHQHLESDGGVNHHSLGRKDNNYDLRGESGKLNVFPLKDLVPKGDKSMLLSIFFNRSVLPAIVLAGLTVSTVSSQVMPKAQVANLIVKVENGADEFRNYLERRGESAQTAAATPQAQTRRGTRGQATESQKATATTKKDELDDALGDLNRSTNRLRRKFDATDKWMETKSEVQRVVDDGRRINQAVTRGNYGAQAAKLWGVLRTGINDLARAYGVTPLGI